MKEQKAHQGSATPRPTSKIFLFLSMMDIYKKTGAIGVFTHEVQDSEDKSLEFQ